VHQLEIKVFKECLFFIHILKVTFLLIAMPSASYLSHTTYFYLSTVHSAVDTEVTVKFIFERNIVDVQISTIM